MSKSEGHRAVALPSDNRCGHIPSREELQFAGVLPHGVLPWYNVVRSCHGGFHVSKHKEVAG